MADNLYVPQMDYTSRDYTSIRDDLLGLIPNFAPQWTSRDSSDFGVVLLEMFAYIGDLLNYQIDRAANEAFIDTATQRTTVINLARILGYIPNTVTPATGTVNLKNTTTGSLSVTKGTTITASNGVVYTTDLAVTGLAASATTSVAVTQGQIISNEVVATSDGTTDQKYSLSKTNVVNNSELVVTVGSTVYTKVDFLINSAPTDAVFSTYTDGSGVTYIVFGDGTSGKVPPSQTSITATYRYLPSSGLLGNISSGTAMTLASPTGISATAAVNFAGGTDAESTDSIRTNATKAIRTLNRAVSLNDYQTIALKTSGIAKANAIASGYSSVIIYVASNNAAPLTSALKAAVTSSFTNKTPPGSTITINDFTSAYPYLNVTVNVLPQYSQTNVVNSVRDALQTLFNFDNVTFADLITEGDIYAACKSIEGVAYVTINDYEKLSSNINQSSGIYSQTGTIAASVGTTLSTNVAANTTTLPVATTAGLVVGMSVSLGTAVPAANSVVINSVNATTVTISATTATTAATGASIVFNSVSSTNYVGIVAGTCGIFSGSKIISAGSAGTGHASVGLSINSVTSYGSSAMNFIKLSDVSSFSSGDVVLVGGVSGTTPGGRDFSCGISEIPIYEDTYVTLTGSGGS